MQVTLVDFLITKEGLEDQLLGEIVTILLPKLEQQRSELILQINNDKQQLLMLEDKVLKLLFSSSENILDDEELVETLNDMKVRLSVKIRIPHIDILLLFQNRKHQLS